MIAVVIKFSVKPNRVEEFIQNWKRLTEYIYEYEGSLGSRLHKEDELTYIAYAQWPDKETLHSAENKLPKEALDVRIKMREACEKIEVLHELEMTLDLLK